MFASRLLVIVIKKKKKDFIYLSVIKFFFQLNSRFKKLKKPTTIRCFVKFNTSRKIQEIRHVSVWM